MCLGIGKETSKVLVHGDDFVSSSERSELEWLCRSMQKKFETKIVMAGDHDDLAKEARVLHQIVMWHPRKGPTYEADQARGNIQS